MNDSQDSPDLQRRKANISKGIRAMKPEDPTRKPCFICSRWQSISHCHHVIEVSRLADFCLEHNFLFLFLPVTFVWLCPNHHEWLHRFDDDGIRDERYDALFADITEAEWQEYMKLRRIREEMFCEMMGRYWLIEGVDDVHEQRKHILERIESKKGQK
jgi:hypothetical protein